MNLLYLSSFFYSDAAPETSECMYQTTRCLFRNDCNYSYPNFKTCATKLDVMINRFQLLFCSCLQMLCVPEDTKCCVYQRTQNSEKIALLKTLLKRTLFHFFLVENKKKVQSIKRTIGSTWTVNYFHALRLSVCLSILYRNCPCIKNTAQFIALPVIVAVCHF